MQSITLALLLSAGLAGAAFAAEEKTAPHGAAGHGTHETGKMQGSPNAAGFDKKNSTTESAQPGNAASPTTGNAGPAGSAAPR